MFERSSIQWPWLCIAVWLAAGFTSVNAQTASPSAAAAAAGAGFMVNPVRVDLKPGQKTAIVTISNNGTLPVRFLVKTVKWTLKPNGEMTLVDDDTLVAFPPSLRVVSGANRTIRVGTDLGPAETERTWRLVLEQLPEPDAPKTQGQIDVTTRMSLPVFLAPLAPKREVRIEPFKPANPEFDISVSNIGNMHVLLGPLVFRGMNESGQVNVQARADGWYILPGGIRTMKLSAEKSWCVGSRNFELELRDNNNQLLATQSYANDQLCN